VQRIWLAVVTLVALAGCPHHVRHTLVPGVPQNGNAQARERFEEARARFERDRSGGSEMAAIARDYPDDPIAPFARLYAGIAAIDKGDYGNAADSLGKVVDDEQADAGLRTRAGLFLGIADAYLGMAADAIPLLARGEPAIENDDERGLWIASSASANAAGPHPLDALGWFDRWWPIAKPAERGFILAKLEEVVAAAPEDAVIPAWEGLADRGGPAAAVLGPRVVDEWVRRGEATSDARTARDAANAARAKVGLPPISGAELAEPDGSHPGLVGAALPLTGKQDRLGEQALHGIAIAAGALGGAGATAADVHDAPTATDAAAAVDALADDGAMAVIGPVDGASVEAAAVRATARGIPLLSLTGRADAVAPAPFVFHMMHSAEARGRTLARRAVAAGVKKFAVLAPDSGYGKAVAKAFADAITAAGGTVVQRVDYKHDTKSFEHEVTQLGGGWEAVFVPTDAQQLGLIAPALDAAGMVPRPWGTRKLKGAAGRPILLLTTAEGASPELLRDNGRHLYGAWLAPGFYPDAVDPQIADYLTRYLAAFGKAPTALDAYAYDAASVVARSGGTSRADLAKRLASGTLVGVTGTLTFGADGRRTDDGVIFVVEDDGAGGAHTKAVR
jgi:ABC-type branched-subunit amino acid transport system substrate-binding protein